MEQELKKRSGHHRLGFWLSVSTAVIVVLGLVLLTLLPYAMEWGAEYMLVRLGAKKAGITDIDFNPLTGYLTVFDLKVEGPNSDMATLERLVVNVDLFPVLKKRVQFQEISVIGLSLDIRQADDGAVTIAGFPIPEKPGEEGQGAASEDQTQPWGLGLKNLDIKEFTVNLISREIKETVVLNHLTLRDLITWRPKRTGQYLVRADLLGGAVDVEGTVLPFAEPMSLSARIGLREIPLAGLIPYMKGTPVEDLSGSLSGRGTVNAAINRRSDPALAGTIQFNLFSRDTSVVAHTQGMELELQPGSINTEVSLGVSISPGETADKVVDFSATTALEGSSYRLATDRASLAVTQDALNFSVSGSYSDTAISHAGLFSAKAGLSTRETVLKDGNGSEELLRLGSLDVKGIEISKPEAIRASQMRATDLALLRRPPGSIGKGEPGQAISLKNFQADGISLSDGALLTVETVQMDSMNAWVLREKGGDLELLKTLGGIRPAAFEPASDKIPEDHVNGRPQTGPAFVINLKKFTLTGENRLDFRDLAVDPPFTFTVDSMNASILNVGTGETRPPTDVTLFAGMGKYSTMSVMGTLQPPWDAPDINTTVRLKAIDLPPLTPYTTKYLGYIVHSGHLDAELDIILAKGTLDSEAHIVVNRIEMDPVKDKDAQRAEERLGIPVNTALSLLKDKNDDIKLNLPVEGNLEDPEFKISDVIVSATGLALKKGVTAYYKGLGATLLTGGLIPPGTFSILGKLFSGATTMTFKPVVFEPLSQELSGQAKAHLDLMAEKLVSKPNVRLVMCGKVTKEDISALRQRVEADTEAQSPKTGMPEQVGLPGPAAGTLEGETTGGSADGTLTTEENPAAGPPSKEDVPLSEEEKEQLIEIAKQRALVVKDYLTESGGLDPERLFVCYSEVDTEGKDLQPRVDLSI